jgi:hypothetical protein
MQEVFNSYVYQWISFVLSIIYFTSVVCAIILWRHKKKLEHCSIEDEKCENCEKMCEKKKKAEKYSKSTTSKILNQIDKIPIIKQ